ncbi:hypothetical protein G7054_g2520 [Neopestalotiopsis clavispora]|nr:hypothetical protein G7054_g2520 [Neopestalotiopsis clavispora]
MSLPQRAEMVKVVKAVMFLAAVNFIFQFGLILDEVPMPTIIKNALCDAGYGKGTSQEHPHLCMHSWLQVDESFGGTVLLMPCPTLLRFATIVTDRPLHNMSAYCMALFLGGGVGIAEAMVFSMINYVWVPNWPNWRGFAFQLASCSILLARPLGSLTARLMMQARGAQSPLWTGSHLIGLALIFAQWLPVRRLPQKFSSPPKQRASQRLVPFLDEIYDVHRIIHNYLRFTRGLYEILLASLVTRPLMIASMEILEQYIEIRYDIDEFALTKLYVVQAIVIIAALMLVVPLIYQLWPARDLRDIFKRELFLAKIFMGFFPCGLMLIGCASSFNTAMFGLILMTAGLPLLGLTRNITTALVEPDRICALHCIMSGSENLAILFFRMILTFLYEMGLDSWHQGEDWLGLPFYFATGLFLVVWLVLWKARPRRFDDFASTWDGRDIVLRTINGQLCLTVEGLDVAMPVIDP